LRRPTNPDRSKSSPVEVMLGTEERLRTSRWRGLEDWQWIERGTSISRVFGTTQSAASISAQASYRPWPARGGSESLRIKVEPRRSLSHRLVHYRWMTLGGFCSLPKLSAGASFRSI